MDKDKLKELIITEIFNYIQNNLNDISTAFITHYKYSNTNLSNLNKCADSSLKLTLDKLIKNIKDNILAKIPNEVVIAEGKAEFDMIFNQEALYFGLGYQPIYLLMKYIKDNKLIGRNVRLKLEILE